MALPVAARGLALAVPGEGLALPVRFDQPPRLVAVAPIAEPAPVGFYFGPLAGAPDPVTRPTVLVLQELGAPEGAISLVLRSPDEVADG